VNREHERTSAGRTVTRRALTLLWSLLGVAVGWAWMIAGSRWLDYQIRNRQVTDAPGTLFVGGMIMTLTFAVRAILVACTWRRSAERAGAILTRLSELLSRLRRGFGRRRSIALACAARSGGRRR